MGHLRIAILTDNYRICWNKRPLKTVIFQRGEHIEPTAFGGWCFQRGEHTKPITFDGGFFKGGSTQNRWDLMGFGVLGYCFYKLSARGVYFGKYGSWMGHLENDKFIPSIAAWANLKVERNPKSPLQEVWLRRTTITFLWTQISDEHANSRQIFPSLSNR